MPLGSINGTLQEAVENYFEPQDIEDNFCTSVCKQNRACNQRYFLANPKIGLAIQVIRQEDINSPAKRTDALELGGNLTLPTVGGVMTEFAMVGVVEHLGTV